MDKREIEKKLKRVKWIRNVINHHLDDVEEILNSVLDEQPKTPKVDIIDDLVKAWVGKTKFKDYTKWASYKAVMDGLKDEDNNPFGFANTVGKLLYAMSMNGIPLDEADRFVKELSKHLKSDTTKKDIEQRLSIYYPKQVQKEILKEDELFGNDLGMP